MLSFLTFVFWVLFFSFVGIQVRYVEAQVEKLEFIEPLGESESFGIAENNPAVINSENLLHIEESDVFQEVGNDPQINPPGVKLWAIIRTGPYSSRMKAQQDLKALEEVFPGNVFFSIVDSEQFEIMEKANNFKPAKSVPATVESKYLVEVNTLGQSLRVRQRPSSSSPVIYRLKSGSKVPLAESAIAGGVEGWFQIEYSKNKFGWISATYSKKIAIPKPSFLREASSKKSGDFDSVKNSLRIANSKYLVEVKTPGHSLRVHQNPSISSRVLYHLKNGSKVHLAESAVAGGVEGWFRIEYSEDQFGWISATYSKKIQVPMGKVLPQLKNQSNIKAQPAFGHLKNLQGIFKKEILPKGDITELKTHKILSDFDISQFHEWVKAWGNQSVDLYLSFYSKSFKGLKRSRAEWVASRRHALRGNSPISI